MADQDPFIKALRGWMEEAMHRSMHAFIRYNRQSALSLSQINALFRLYYHGSSPVNDLADHLGITMAAVSQLLAPLEKSGLIQRTEDPHDRRVKRIALTEKGAHRVQEGMRARHAWLDELAALLTDAEKEQILPAILLLTQSMQTLKGELHSHKAHPIPINLQGQSDA
jgi:DNA-binding MarR family transcriptional regulator